MSKPTMQDIADALSTSRITVWKALNNRPGVSSEMRERIHQKCEELGYIRGGSPAPAGAGSGPASRTVAAVVSRPESSVFWMEIIHQLAKELSLRGINLMYTYLPSFYKENYNLPPALSDGSVSGIIVMNVYSEELLRMLAELSTPKIFLDSVPSVTFAELNSSLVMIEGRCMVREITERLLDTGRRRLCFIGDINYAQTNTDRYHGFLDAFASRGLSVDPAYTMTGHLGLRTHYEEISAFLHGLPALPQGFVCASDYIAHFIERYYTEHTGVDPSSLVLTGFDNNAEYANIAEQITTVDVDTKALGARLGNKILFAMDHPLASYELSYINSDILYRGPLAEGAEG